MLQGAGGDGQPAEISMVIVGPQGSAPVSAVEGETVLAVLQRNRVSVAAPCGGRGTCGKCKVLVEQAKGALCVLACKTPVQEGMRIHVDAGMAMEVTQSGLESPWEADGSRSGFGVAIDVGTTTVVARLYNLETGAMLAQMGKANSQIIYGADVISRISACTDGKLAELAGAIGNQLADMVESLCAMVGVSVEDVCRLVLAGNTVMQTIACAIDPTPLGVSPFTPPSLFGNRHAWGLVDGSGGQAELRFVQADGGTAYLAPCIAAYVGGDISCGMLAVDMGRAEKPVLLLDLGTNGEMALGDAQGTVACATAAGPVFEGAGITCGMPAYPGAISRVVWQDGQLLVEVVGEPGLQVAQTARAQGLCGTGLVDAIAFMLEYGLVDETGAMEEPEYVAEEFRGLLATVDGFAAVRLTADVAVTQRDVRAFQLAKAAIAAGIQVMLNEMGLQEHDVAQLYVAGGFGRHLDMDSAARVGLFPASMRPVAQAVGNSAIEGAMALLVSEAAQDQIDALVRACRYVELSTHQGFNAAYIDAMEFPED